MLEFHCHGVGFENKMSSNVTKNFVLGMKLVVHVADNGHSFEVECDGSTPVEDVQQWLEEWTGIRFNDQLLLCLDMRLEAQQPLSAYKLPDGDHEVFLYNRARFHHDSPLPPLEQVDIPTIIEPPLSFPSQDPLPFDDSSDPAGKALISYERQFRYHFQCGKAIYSSTQLKYEACQRLLREQLVQERAFEAARGSMEHYYQMVHQMYVDFMKCYSQLHRYHSDLLVNFGRVVEKLKSCMLHPSIQIQSRKCLLDLAKEDNLQKWVNCNSSHRQFELKVAQFKAAFTDLKQRAEDLFSSKASTGFRDTELMIQQHQRHLNEQKSIMQSLSEDVNTVKKLVDDCLSCQLSASLRPHDAVSALGPMFDVHDKKHLPKMQACDRAISELLEFCKAKKNEKNLFMHSGMQKVSYVQYMIKDIRLQFLAFKEAMGRQEDIFTHMKLVRGIGPAYRACLAEVVRRKASMKLYMGLAGQLAEKIAMKREVEVRRRDEFLKVQSVYIPHDVLASLGLFGSPSHCNVNIAPFDTNLLEIDIMDVDRCAPGSLLGISSRNEKHAMLKGSSIMSSGSSHLAETEDNSIDNSGKCDTENLLAVYGPVDTAGTSKFEVENARLKADLASAIAQLCYFGADFEYISLDDSKLDSLLKSNAEKTADALHLKDKYAKHLQSMLEAKKMQCLSYEKRIQELEQRLSDQYLNGQKILGDKDTTVSNLSTVKIEDCKSEISGEGDACSPFVSTEPMEEVSCSSQLLDQKLEKLERQTGKHQEGIDENMTDFSGMLNQQPGDSMSNSMDLLILEQKRNAPEVGEQSGKEETPYLDILQCGPTAEPSSPARAMDDILLELQSALEEKSNQCSEAETKLKAALEEVVTLRRELENKHKYLDESQMKCAHLENFLHEAREEARTNLCALFERLRALFERLRSSFTATGDPAGFADSLCSLALSLASSLNNDENDGTVEFRACIKVLSDKVGILSRQHTELVNRCLRVEAAQNRLIKELEENKELIKNLYAKHQLEKQVNKEKISFGRFELHELAAFVLNSAGHYEAINRNCSNCFLSPESVALFTDHPPSSPSYIIGQIVHIEQRTVKPIASIQDEKGDQADLPSSEASRTQLSHGLGPSANLYGLAIGCEYFVVTVAMLPDSIHSPSSISCLLQT